MGSHVGRCRKISRVRGDYADYTRSHHHPGTQLGVGSSRNWSVFLERLSTRRLRFFVLAAGLLRSLVLHGCCARVAHMLRTLLVTLFYHSEMQNSITRISLALKIYFIAVI